MVVQLLAGFSVCPSFNDEAADRNRTGTCKGEASETTGISQTALDDAACVTFESAGPFIGAERQGVSMEDERSSVVHVIEVIDVSERTPTKVTRGPPESSTRALRSIVLRI